MRSLKNAWKITSLVELSKRCWAAYSVWHGEYPKYLRLFKSLRPISRMVGSTWIWVWSLEYIYSSLRNTLKKKPSTSAATQEKVEHINRLMRPNYHFLGPLAPLILPQLSLCVKKKDKVFDWLCRSSDTTTAHRTIATTNGKYPPCEHPRIESHSRARIQGTN